MTKAEAVRTLRAHNEWRRGDYSVVQTPKDIGLAIDTAIRLLSQKRKRKTI